ncbi:MAG: flagellar basal body L-ring protein FlgH [Alphaproteobacteria bacterium]|nr:flagellar basal body L-ring protein FlgH [Alphaproteobacteria bacterium]
MAIGLGGCSNTVERLSQVGEKPPLTEIQNPTQTPNYRPVSLPMPVKTHAESRPNSLWRTGARAFFRDQRAGQVGDILTVVIDIDDKAELNNTTDRTRTTTENDEIGTVLGIEGLIDGLMPKDFSRTNPINVTGETQNKGSGKIDRDEEINVKVAAVVTQVLPNGNLVIRGRQEVRVNYEVRELSVTGIVRREDIGSDNKISYEKIAEARIAYGGRGHLTDVQQPRYGTQILDIIYPF